MINQVEGQSMALFILAACSGTGKSTLVKALLEQHPNLRLSVSHTTRLPRQGEENHVAYHFISRDEFKIMIKHNNFVEWAEFAGNLYGTSHTMIQHAQKAGHDLLFEVEIQGATRLKESYPHAISCFVLPPSWESLAERLRVRKTETEESIHKRLTAGYQEIYYAKNFNYMIINDDFEQALTHLSSLYQSQDVAQQDAHVLLEKLLATIPQ
jgi:guanylate kinase